MQNLLSSSSGSVMGSTLLANSGKQQILSVLSVLNSSDWHSDSWMLDSAATDQMTPISTIFVSYKPCSMDIKVQTVDDTLLEVAGRGSVKVELIELLTRASCAQNYLCLFSVKRPAELSEYKIIFDGIDTFCATRCMGGRLNLLKSNLASTTYLA